MSLRKSPVVLSQRVVELLSRQVFPFWRITHAGGRRCLAIQRKIHRLAGSTFSSEVGRLIKLDSAHESFHALRDLKDEKGIITYECSDRERTRTRASGGSARLCPMKHLATRGEC